MATRYLFCDAGIILFPIVRPSFFGLNMTKMTKISVICLMKNTRTPFPCQSPSLKCDSIRNILDNLLWNLCDHSPNAIEIIRMSGFFFSFLK